MSQKSFSVRCLFKWESRRDPEKDNTYEERITLWKAQDIDDAIAKAEIDARQYAKDIEAEYLGFAQAYFMYDQSDSSGIEVFSLVRDSDLDENDYLDAFFDTGFERQKS